MTETLFKKRPKNMNKKLGCVKNRKTYLEKNFFFKKLIKQSDQNFLTLIQEFKKEKEFNGIN